MIKPGDVVDVSFAGTVESISEWGVTLSIREGLGPIIRVPVESVSLAFKGGN